MCCRLCPSLASEQAERRTLPLSSSWLLGTGSIQKSSVSVLLCLKTPGQRGQGGLLQKRGSLGCCTGLEPSSGQGEKGWGRAVMGPCRKGDTGMGLSSADLGPWGFSSALAWPEIVLWSFRESVFGFSARNLFGVISARLWDRRSMG